MGVFGKSNAKAQHPSGTTTIAEGAKVVGEINVHGKLHIDGEAEGRINIDDSISIGKKGRVKGEIFAGKITITGEFEGSIEGDVIEILSGGKVVGRIICEDLIIEQKGIFIGESLRKNDPSLSSTDTLKIENIEQKAEEEVI